MKTDRPADNPLFHFTAYGLLNPMVQWCIERGAYDQGSCRQCWGKGTFGKVWTPTGNVDARCPRCEGRGLEPLDSPHAVDIGNDMGEEVAKKLGIRVRGHEFPCTARKPGDRCRCELR